MKKIFIANWKMTGSYTQAHDYFSIFKGLLKDNQDLFAKDRSVIFCPASPYLSFVDGVITGTGVHLGAQDCSAHEGAAHTAETSAAMVKDVGCSHVLLGHSEYRQRFSPSADVLSKKINQALEQDLIPVFCIGESLDHYKDKITKSILEKQLSVLEKVQDLQNLHIAYEPVWAIGSGKVPTLDDIEETCSWIGEYIAKNHDIVLPILYGGSVKPDNAAEMISLPSVQGVLVGGASLKPDDFFRICCV